MQFTLEELLKFNLLYPDSISDMCLSKLAALRSDQQNQVLQCANTPEYPLSHFSPLP